MSTYLKVLQEQTIRNHHVKLSENKEIINEAEDKEDKKSPIKGSITPAQNTKFKTSAKKMVDNIEAKRKDGKYTDDERSKLEKKFYDNMVNMITKKGDI